jgi:hypothetical protein
MLEILTVVGAILSVVDAVLLVAGSDSSEARSRAGGLGSRETAATEVVSGPKGGYFDV